VNVAFETRRGTIYFPILGCLGMIAIATVLLVVLYTHEIARVAGPLWVVLCFLYYARYRRSRNLPILRSLPRDWEGEQKNVLTSAEEFDLLEQYKVALAERDRRPLRPELQDQRSRRA
jgi:APA family basic amino acid/polyamine antiporter